MEYILNECEQPLLQWGKYTYSSIQFKTLKNDVLNVEASTALWICGIYVSTMQIRYYPLYHKFSKKTRFISI